ncbi:nitrile hydratase subunit alpha [Candidatus Poriferisodalis multihospitum]|uniref:nitrile hydratase subunit alpha n=1 Tax=Candidatus Poriferisodalis multihospitum TaxID=2983191 RepID=UPI0023921ACF|nr:nitrile hydratase subunit alpha [Candidatus Poriferisodalis multihospitum]MDE0320125.1 nitrile hydratase subunit alpha [Acidimicrobiaceae bacterium]
MNDNHADGSGHGDHDHRNRHDASSPDIRVEALEDLLVERGIADRGRIDAIIERFEHDISPMIGARLVAQAWIDPGLRQQLLTDADAVLADMDIRGAEIEHIEVKFNEPGVHNVVVCTLCSCYPWALLGLPPNWYKSPEYRARVVREPRVVLSEMGLELSPSTELRVWDSSSETRFLVLPERPAGTEGWPVERLADLVTRDSMIGVARAADPGSQ